MSNTSTPGDKQTRLKVYIDRMKEGQSDIPDITGEFIAVASSLRVIKKNLVKQCLEMFAEIAEEKDDYIKFHKQFGKCLKFGTHEDSTDRTKIAESFKFNTSTPGDKQTSLKEYIFRMKKDQYDILTSLTRTSPLSPLLA